MDGLLPDDDDVEGHGLMRVGSLFSGYGGLDMAVGGEVAWYSDIEPAACTVLEAHYPNVPNIGDIKLVNWNNVEPVDVIVGGYPCQPFSSSGKQLGEKDERHLWPYVREAIGTLRPGLVILENVRGHLTLGFNKVLGQIAELGYNARWGIVRASDAGAPHQRARLFIAAYPNSGGPIGYAKHDGQQEPQFKVGKEYAPEWKDAYGLDMGEVRLLESWGKIVGRPAPHPERSRGRNGQPRVSPVFVEWMMGLPEGHVTGHGLKESDELKMLGNGVVPQQAALALKLLGVAA